MQRKFGIGKEKKKATTVFTVQKESQLMEFLLQNIKKKSRNNIKSLLKRKQVLIDGRAVSQFDYILKPGQKITIKEYDEKKEIKKCALDIVYEDDDIFVINKPSGLLSMASDKEKTRTAYRLLMDYVRELDANKRIFIVHRLDRDTSGLMLFAKNEEVKNILQENWKSVVVERGYVALVHDDVKNKSGQVRSWLRETKTHMMYSSQTPGDGLEAVTNYTVMQTTPQYSLLKVHLNTGRKNQIRVHMKDIGHPIVGDKMYGSWNNPASRLCLHAYLLAFHHPKTGEIMRFESKTPKAFLTLLRK